MKVLTLLLILMMTSSCGLLKDKIREPLCVPTDPVLVSISVEEQADIAPMVLHKLGDNQSKLVTWIRTTKRIVEVHNEQFEATCSTEEL